MMSKKDLAKKIVVEISRALLGITFIFSGFVKSVDPYGTAYKIADYFSAFKLTSFDFLTLPIAITLCVLELALGIFLLLGIYRKWSSKVVLLVMLFMTPLTLYLAIYEPVQDCGCFGDALIITNWETFFKNIVLLLCAVVVFLWHDKISNFVTGKFYWIVGFYTLLFCISFAVYNSIYEPVIDFRPYAEDANLPKLISVEPGKGDVFENRLIYEKNGVKEEFTEANYPWQDTTWVFVERTTKLVKEGEKPLIKDFEINKLFFNENRSEIVEEENITQEVLSDEGYTFLMISYSLPKMNESHLSKFEDVSNYAKDNGYRFYCLTSSLKDDIIAWENENKVDFNFALTDERTLKTITRSNPGLVLLKNGVIIKKWAGFQVPQEESWTKPLTDQSFRNTEDKATRDKNMLKKIALIFVVPIFGFKVLDFLFYRKRKELEQEGKTNLKQE